MKTIFKKDINNILIVMLGGIGNLIQITPALKALRAHFKDSRITLMTAENNVEDIIAGSNLIDGVILLHKTKQMSLVEKLNFLIELRKMKFDLAIASSGINAFKGSLLTFMLGIPHRVGENIDGTGFWYSRKTKYVKGLNETDAMLNLVKCIGVPVQDELPFLTIPEEDALFVSRFLSDCRIEPDDLLIGIHSGSGFAQRHFKRWYKERFAMVGDELVKKYNAKVVLTGSAQETDLTNQIANLMASKPINTAGKLSVRQTAALIKKCNVFISNDSGVAHIASAVQTPLVVIFGGTNAAVAGPKGKNATIIRKDLSCSPCYYKGSVKCDQLDCLNQITVEDVLDAIEKLLGKNGDKPD